MPSIEGGIHGDESVVARAVTRMFTRTMMTFTSTGVSLLRHHIEVDIAAAIPAVLMTIWADVPRETCRTTGPVRSGRSKMDAPRIREALHPLTNGKTLAG